MRLLPTGIIYYALTVAFGLQLTLANRALAVNDAVITASPGDASIKPAEILRLSNKTLLLDIVKTPYGYMAVGERGHVLRSSNGQDWTQLKIDTRSTLTSVAAVGDNVWIAGHDGVIFHSKDRGETWQRQRTVPWSIDDTNAAHGVPILDLYFADENNGFAVGAFSLLLRTSDGGVNWNIQSVFDRPRSSSPDATAASDQANASSDDATAANDNWTFSAEDLELEDEVDPHLNAITGNSRGTLYVAGERGALLRSRNGGITWDKLKFPYDGSMFGLVSWSDSQLMAFGLRGNVFESFDGGESWQKIESGTASTLMGGISLPDGGAIIVGNGGVVLQRPNRRTPFSIQTYQTSSGETPVLSGVVSNAENELLLIGEKGADIFRAKQ